MYFTQWTGAISKLAEASIYVSDTLFCIVIVHMGIRGNMGWFFVSDTFILHCQNALSRFICDSEETWDVIVSGTFILHCHNSYVNLGHKYKGTRIWFSNVSLPFTSLFVY